MALNLQTETVFTDDTAAAQPPLPPDQIAPHFPQLEILECLGRGGMGVVYKARQKSLNRFAALKLLAPERVHDAKFAERFAREAQALAALNHPNIVTIYDFGQAGGFYYLLMEFVDGVNLRQLLRVQKFTPEEALAIIPPLCDALQFAHDRGIVHRDIKPENLLLDKSGRVKVADFGVAKIMEPGRADLPVSPDIGVVQQHGPTGILGTPGYSAPEQKTDPQRVDSRADIYSMGVVFYEMLTGELPDKRLEPPSRKVHIDVRLDEVVLRALERQPELRYQQASEVKTCVETIAATPESGGSRSRKAGEAQTKSGKVESASVPQGGTTADKPAGVPGDEVDLVGHWWKRWKWGMAALALIILFLANMADKKMEQRIDKFTFGAALVIFLIFEVFDLRYTKKHGWSFMGENEPEAEAEPHVLPAGREDQNETFIPSSPDVIAVGPWVWRFGACSSNGQRRPPALIVAGLLFILLGVYSIGDMVWYTGPLALRFDPGLLCLPVGIGLLRLRWRWRRLAVVVVWLGYATLILFLTLMFARANGWALLPGATALEVFGWKPGAVPATWLLVVAFWGGAALLLWLHRVLTRPEVKALYERQRGQGPDWLETLVVGALMLFAFGWIPQQARLAEEKAHPIAQEFRQVDRAPFVARMHQGSVELLAVGDQPWTNTVCWRPNGELSPNPFPAGYGGDMSQWAQNRVTKKAAFRIHNESTNEISYSVCRVSAESGIQPGSSREMSPVERGQYMGFGQLFTCPSNAATMNVSLGVANGPWETVVTLAHENNGSGSAEINSPKDGEWSATFNSVAGLGGTVAVNCNYSQNTNWESRMVGVGANGNITKIPGNSSNAGTLQAGGLLVLSSNDFVQIKEFQLQRRPYQWVEFRDVSLQPGHRTTVGVRDASVGTEGNTTYPPNPVLPTARAAFGPVVERAITLAPAGSNYVICFKSGEVRTPPRQADGSMMGIHPWMMDADMDAAAGVLANSSVLSGYDMAAITVPAQCWEELTPVQAARRLEAETSEAFKIMSYGQAATLPDTCLFRTRSGVIGLLQVTGRLTDPPGLKVRYKLLDQPFDRPAAAGVATGEWSPDLLPGEKPDLRKILAEARQQTDSGHYKEALQRQLWFHNHAQEFGDAWQNSVRRTSALSDWVELGRRYPKAKRALLEIRDEKTRKIAAGQGYSELFLDVQAINRELEDEDATYALYKIMFKTDKQLARQCYFYMEGPLVQKGEYALCLNFIGDPQTRFEMIRSQLERERNVQEQQRESQQRLAELQKEQRQRQEEMMKSNNLPLPPVTPFRPPDMGEMATNSFVGQICTLVEILVGAGDQPTAEKIRDEALMVVEDARLKSAVDDAEHKVHQ